MKKTIAHQANIQMTMNSNQMKRCLTHLKFNIFKWSQYYFNCSGINSCKFSISLCDK